jgi:hypothetical protein
VPAAGQCAGDSYAMQSGYLQHKYTFFALVLASPRPLKHSCRPNYLCGRLREHMGEMLGKGNCRCSAVLQ